MNKKIIFTSGLALFAMFFGAGNIIFPLALGAKAGDHFIYVIAAFLVAGIGLPILGLFTASLYEGNYYNLFSKLGKIPSFLLITFLILIIGPLFGAPRTETVSYHTLNPFLPTLLQNPFVFSALYCFLIFLCTYKQTRIVDIIGKILSPIKLLLFSILIIVGLSLHASPIESEQTMLSSIKLGLVNGYSTMDLLASFFFSSVICQHILSKSRSSGIKDPTAIIRVFLYACLVGAGLLAFVYTGFMLVAAKHAAYLQQAETADMIMIISKVVLGGFGSLFVCVCVGFACLVTAIALTEVSTGYFYDQIFRQKIPRLACLVGTLTFIYGMSIIGFSGIMKIALPILEVLYPALIVFCLFSITVTLYSMRKMNREAQVQEPQTQSF